MTSLLTIIHCVLNVHQQSTAMVQRTEKQESGITDFQRSTGVSTGQEKRQLKSVKEDKETL